MRVAFLMKYGLYKTDISSFCDIDTYKGERLHLIVSRVSPKSVGLIEAIMWNVFCLGRCKLYRMYYNETMVHSSLVARGSFKFTFLRKMILRLALVGLTRNIEEEGYIHICWESS